MQVEGGQLKSPELSQSPVKVFHFSISLMHKCVDDILYTNKSITNFWNLLIEWSFGLETNKRKYNQHWCFQNNEWIAGSFESKSPERNKFSYPRCSFQWSLCRCQHGPPGMILDFHMLIALKLCPIYEVRLLFFMFVLKDNIEGLFELRLKKHQIMLKLCVLFPTAYSPYDPCIVIYVVNVHAFTEIQNSGDL